MSALVTQIKDAARGLGFEVAAITSVEPLVRDAAAFQEWREAGFAAGMEYMTRRPGLHTDPRALVPTASSLITVAINYYATAPEFGHENRFGRVARYAWGLDYHDVVKPRLSKLVAEIERIAGREVHSRCFVDAVPLLERAVAARAGLGFFGKNTNLIRPQGGSWFFLAEVLIDLDLPAEDREVRVSCGSCRRCIDACPTNAFAASYVLDSRRCISYLTIEHKGAIPRELREGMGDWVFGCDVCQEICPFNRFSSDADWPELRPEAGVGPRIDLAEVLSIRTDEEFRRRFKGTPLTRPKRRGLLRNAAIAAANIDCTAAIPALIDCIKNDPEPFIRSHALWAIARLDPKEAKRLIDRSLQDSDREVRKEGLLLIESQE